MLQVDIQNAFDSGRGADNFTVKLLQLIAKSDADNRMRLRKGFPVAVRAVELFQHDCPYLNEIADDGCRKVDWKTLAERAEKEA